MRIVDRKTFLALPAVYAKFNPHMFGDLAIKDETLGSDFVTQDLVDPGFEGVADSGAYMDTIFRMMDGEPSPPLDYECAGRDGLFDEDQLFAVFDADDVARLIARLQEAQRTANPSA